MIRMIRPQTDSVPLANSMTDPMNTHMTNAMADPMIVPMIDSMTAHKINFLTDPMTGPLIKTNAMT